VKFSSIWISLIVVTAVVRTVTLVVPGAIAIIPAGADPHEPALDEQFEEV
jgi:hypothetical protein